MRFSYKIKSYVYEHVSACKNLRKEITHAQLTKNKNTILDKSFSLFLYFKENDLSFTVEAPFYFDNSDGGEYKIMIAYDGTYPLDFFKTILDKLKANNSFEATFGNLTITNEYISGIFRYYEEMVGTFNIKINNTPCNEVDSFYLCGFSNINAEIKDLVELGTS